MVTKITYHVDPEFNRFIMQEFAHQAEVIAYQERYRTDPKFGSNPRLSPRGIDVFPGKPIVVPARVLDSGVRLAGKRLDSFGSTTVLAFEATIPSLYLKPFEDCFLEQAARMYMASKKQSDSCPR